MKNEAGQTNRNRAQIPVCPRLFLSAQAEEAAAAADH